MSERPSAFSAVTEETDTEQFQELITGIVEGFNRKDAEVLDARFAADAVLVAPDGRMVRGWEDLFAYHTERLADAVVDWSTAMSILSVNKLGSDVAVVHVRQDTTTSDRAFGNHGTIVMVERDGKWWIAAFHNTTVSVRTESGAGRVRDRGGCDPVPPEAAQ
ncbi:YybH family protein [Nocardia sp. X0981]